MDQTIPGRAFLVCCGLVLAVDTLFSTALRPLYPYFAERFDMSPGEIGVLAGAYPAGGTIAAIPSAFLATRVGAKPSLVLGLGLMVMASALFGLATTGTDLVLIRLAQGVGSTLSWIAAFTWLLARIPASRRGEVIGLGYGVSMIGALVGPAVAPALPEVGAGVFFGAMAGLFAFLCLAFLCFPSPPTTHADLRAGIRLLLRSPGVAIGFWVLTVQALLFGALSVLGPLRLADFGFTLATVAAVYVAIGGLAIGVSPAAGRWSDRRGRLKPLQLAMAGTFVGVFALPWLDQGWGYALVLVSTSVILFVPSAPASAVISDAVDARSLSFAIGWAVILLGQGPGNIVGPVGAGYLIETTTASAPYFVMAILCALILALLCAERVRRGIEGPHPSGCHGAAGRAP